MKQVIKCTHSDRFYIDEKLSVIRDQINELIDMFGENALFRADDWCDLDFVIQFEREETDEEYAERLKKEEEKKNKSLAAKKRQLEKLQKEIEELS